MPRPRRIYFAVAELSNPRAEPYAVMRIDPGKRIGRGVEARVESLHWSRYVAEQIAAQLNADPAAQEVMQ